MKKAQQEDRNPFLLHRNGELIAWGADDLKNLLNAANEAKIDEETKTRKLTSDEYFKIIVHDWFEIFVNEGISEKAIKHLNARLSHIRFHHILMYSKTELPYWRHIADSNSLMTDPELRSAYGITHLIAIGALRNLKRCEMKECRKFFVGPSNRKWCSKSCGSLFRVRKQRISIKNRF